MSRFAVDHLSPLAARRRLEEVDLEEKSRLAEGLALIALIDSRGDYLEAGYSCMQRYCIEHLRMSEEKAQRRIRAALWVTSALLAGLVAIEAWRTFG